MSEKPRLSVRMSNEEAWAMLTDAHTGILTTLRRDGVPIALPLWYAVVDHCIYFTTRGKKLSRVRHDPRSSFLVEEGERWVDLRAVHLTGVAEIVEPEESVRSAFGAEMQRKYAAYRAAGGEMPEKSRKHYETAKGGIVRFTPDEKILTWDNRKLGGA